MEICSAYTYKHGGAPIYNYLCTIWAREGIDRFSESGLQLCAWEHVKVSAQDHRSWWSPHKKKHRSLWSPVGTPHIKSMFFCQLVEMLWQQKEIHFLPFHRFLFEASMRIEIDKAYFYALPYWALAEKSSSTCRCILALVPTLVWEEGCMLAISPTLVKEVVVWYH